MIFIFTFPNVTTTPSQQETLIMFTSPLQQEVRLEILKLYQCSNVNEKRYIFYKLIDLGVFERLYLQSKRYGLFMVSIQQPDKYQYVLFYF